MNRNLVGKAYQNNGKITTKLIATGILITRYSNMT